MQSAITLRRYRRLTAAFTAIAIAQLSGPATAVAHIATSPRHTDGVCQHQTTRRQEADGARAEGLTIARLEFRGNRRIRDRSLYMIFGVHPGTAYSASKIAEGIRRLNESGKIEPLALRDVVVTVDDNAATVDVEIRVTERW